VGIRRLLIDELKPRNKNPRVNDSAVHAVVKSIETFGFNVPILYDQHMRMINCLDCGFCVVECFRCRRFDR